MKKSETKKFIAVIDTVALTKSTFVYKELNAKNLIKLAIKNGLITEDEGLDLCLEFTCN